MDNNALIEELAAEFDALKQERDPWHSTWQEITNYVLPRRAGVNPDGTLASAKVEVSTDRVDSTATEAATMMADGLMGYTVSPSYPWFKLALEDQMANKSRVNRSYLDEVEKVMYAEFQKSNFYSIMPEVFADGDSIGTATLYIDENVEERALQFISVHPYKVFIEDDSRGVVTQVFRRFSMTDKQAKREFGAEAWDNMEVQYGQRRNIIHALIPNRPDSGISADFPWVGVYFEADSHRMLRVEPYYENPFVVWRYRKNTGETYGRSPAYDALPDIRVLNLITKALARGVQLATDPPYNVPMAMKGKEKLVPRGANYYMNPNEIITPIQYGSAYNIGKDYHMLMIDRVRKAFRADIFLSLEAATRQMTAEEVMQRQGEKAAVLGAIVGRLGAELLNPLIKRVFGILYRAGKLPEEPDEIKGAGLKIEYQGPLFQAQQRYHSTNGLMQTLGSIIPLQQVFPGALDSINPDGVVRELLEAGSMPAETYRDKKEVSQIRQARAQAQAEAQAQQMQLEQMKALPGLGKAIEPKSPLDRMAQAAQGAVGGIG